MHVPAASLRANVAAAMHAATLSGAAEENTVHGKAFLFEQVVQAVANGLVSGLSSRASEGDSLKTW